jgi:hypothetical protein
MLTRALVFVLGLSLALATGNAQTTSRRRGRSSQATDNPSSNSLQAVFTGTVTSLTRSDLSLQAEGGNTLVFSILRKTRFVKDSKPAKRADIHTGDTVTIQAGEDPDGHPAALTVTIGKPAA